MKLPKLRHLFLLFARCHYTDVNGVAKVRLIHTVQNLGGWDSRFTHTQYWDRQMIFPIHYSRLSLQDC